MEDSDRSVEYAASELPFGGPLKVLRPALWKLILLSFLTGIVAIGVTFLMPKLYEASGTIVPATEEGKPNLSAGLGVLVSSFGISLGGPTRIEDLEALFKSRELTVRVFRRHDLWPLLYPDDFDPDTGKLKVGWIERLTGVEGESKKPGDWDAVRAVKDRLDISVSRKMGTISIAFESRSPEGSSRIVSYYLGEAKNHMQEKALERANRNKKFLEGQIGKTVDPIIRERLYTLYGQEVEREMLALNKEQFGFTVLDPPMVPDRKSRPRRRISAIAATLLSFPAWGVFLYIREKKRRESEREDQPSM